MSETVHYKGKLTPTGKTILQYMDIVLPSGLAEQKELFEDEVDGSAIEINGLVFTVDSEWYDDNDEISKSNKNADGTIDFEVKYYNGGCGFIEALNKALGKG